MVNRLRALLLTGDDHDRALARGAPTQRRLNSMSPVPGDQAIQPGPAGHQHYTTTASRQQGPDLLHASIMEHQSAGSPGSHTPGAT